MGQGSQLPRIEDQKAFFARRSDLKKKIQRRTGIKSNLQKRVHLTRSYRIGELPDINITISAIISPLKLLCLRDAEVAGSSFQKLLGGIDIELGEVLAKILAECKTRHVASSIMSTAVDLNQSIPLEATMIANVAIQTQNAEIGIALLESTVIAPSTPTRPAKRAKLEAPDLSSKWYGIARLYKSLGNNSIFVNTILEHVDDEVTMKEAIEAETAHDFKRAASLYQNSWKSAESGSEAKIMCMDRQRECLSKLCNWSSLEETFRSIDVCGKVTDRTLVSNYLWASIHCGVTHGEVDTSAFQRISELRATNANIEDSHPIEFSLLSLLEGDLDKSIHLVGLWKSQFLASAAANRLRSQSSQSDLFFTQIVHDLNVGI